MNQQPSPSKLAMKIPKGKEIDLQKILRAKSQKINSPTLKSPEKVKENEEKNQALDTLIKGVSLFSRASKEAKLVKKHQTFATNQFLTNKWQQDAFERIKIQSDNVGGNEETLIACKNISAVLKLRYKYLFHQHKDCKYHKKYFFSHYHILFIILDVDVEKLIKDKNAKEPIIDYKQQIPLISDLNVPLECVDGVYQATIQGKNSFHMPNMVEFIKDLAFIIEQTHNVTNKTFAHNRLEILENKFKMHLSFNRDKESLQLQSISHRDFYNVRKIDTHVHHSAAMRAKHLLEFIIRKMEVIIIKFIYFSLL